MRSTYTREDLGVEVVAPSGYYVPLEEHVVQFRGEQLLYVLGSYCVEASCCGVGSRNYIRVEGYVRGDGSLLEDDATSVEIDTIEDAGEKIPIRDLLLNKHPGVAIEFR